MKSTELYCIIADNKKTETEREIKSLKAAVFVNLFYEDQVGIYQAYLEKISAYIDIFIISSKDIILNEFNGERYQKVKKKNRGRDISALLVAVKDIIFRYEYVCFIHDKKEKKPDTMEYVDQWRKNMWDNMLQSDIYVYNILELFASDPDIGMLVPLPPYGKDMGAWLNGAWGENYDNICSLAKELDVVADLCYEEPPVSYSTVFWTRPQALRKLFLKDWKYSDFSEEPMKDDGEINHAIERILEYVVKDAGYEIKIVLSASFASKFIEQLNAEMNNLWNQLKKTIGVKDYRGLEGYRVTVEKIRKFASKYTDIYLYGGGKRGRECLTVCHLIGIFPKGFVVTEWGKNNLEIEGVPVLSISDVVLNEKVGIIISVGSTLQSEIKRELEQRNFKEYIVF